MPHRSSFFVRKLEYVSPQRCYLTVINSEGTEYSTGCNLNFEDVCGVSFESSEFNRNVIIFGEIHMRSLVQMIFAFYALAEGYHSPASI